MNSDATTDRTDEISLAPYIQILKGYRRIIGASLLGMAGFYLVGVLLVALLSPVERTGSVQFRLLFDGAERGEYPNHTLFNPAEIVAAPVLTEVFRSNNLGRFGKYEDFKDSVFVLQSNAELEMLTYEYRGLLADTKLVPVDRARIEDEFRRRRAALADPMFSVNMRRSERLVTLPRDLMNKVLIDILNVWAKQAYERKGATRYNVDVLSAGILQRDVLDREDYLVAIDILRAKTIRVIDTLDEIAKLPGARTIRVGPAQVSLAEVRAGLEDVIRFKLEPLLGLIRSEGVAKNPRSLVLYASNQAFQLRQERQESADRVRALQDSLREFTAQGPQQVEVKGGGAASGAVQGGAQSVMAQFDQSFLDRIMALSTAREDSQYKRKLTDRIIEESDLMAAKTREASYYEGLVKELQGSSSRASGASDVVRVIASRTAEAYEEISKGIEQTATIYRDLSALNLNPSTAVYTVTEPFSMVTRWALTMRTIGSYFVLLMALTGILVPIGCLVHHAFRKNRTA